MATDTVIRAATRIRETLTEARAGNYYRNGWYAYMSRWDIEVLVSHVLGPERDEDIGEGIYIERSLNDR